MGWIQNISWRDQKLDPRIKNKENMAGKNEHGNEWADLALSRTSPK
jgi:hypothetical protein